VLVQGRRCGSSPPIMIRSRRAIRARTLSALSGVTSRLTPSRSFSALWFRRSDSYASSRFWSLARSARASRLSTSSSFADDLQNDSHSIVGLAVELVEDALSLRNQSKSFRFTNAGVRQAPCQYRCCVPLRDLPQASIDRLEPG